MNPQNQPSKRRKHNNLPVPLKYAVILSLVSGFMTLVMIFVMAFFIQRNYNLFMGDELGVSSQVIELVRKEQQLLEMTLFIVFLATLSVMFATSFFVTRKLTGPMAALERHLHLYSNGDWSREFKLRKNDEFKQMETIVNGVRHNHLEKCQSA